MMLSERDEGRRRHLAVFRHAPTKKGEGRGQGSHLSAEGVALARQIGDNLGPFDRVYVSPFPRTMETALAMGYAVDAVIEFSCGYVPGEFEHHDQWGWEQPYVRFAELLRSDGTLSQRAAEDAALWKHLLTEAPAGGRVLILSHGGSIEPVLVACLPDAEHAAWGAPFSHCDGVLLTFDGGRFRDVTFQRAPQSG
jgi:broad specificity phosphatase PhoE